MERKIRVLAVGDPAVEAYVDPKYEILSDWASLSRVAVDFKIMPWEQYYHAMMDNFNQAESRYDIVMVAGHLWLRDFVDKGYLAAVDDKIMTGDPSYDDQDILPIVREEIALNQRQYLFPSFCDGHMLLYRKSLAEKRFGYLPGDTVTTDEIIQMAALTHLDGLYGIVLKAHQSEILLDFLPYLRNEGIDLFDAENRPSFNNDLGVAALKKYKSLKQYAPPDTHTYGNEAVKAAIQDRKCVFAVTWGGQLGTVMRREECLDMEDIGFLNLKTPWNVTWCFGVHDRSHIKDECFTFLKYLTSKTVDKKVGRYSGSPIRKSTYEDTDERKLCPWYPQHLRMVEQLAKPLPKLKNGGQILGVLYEKIYQAFEDQMTEKEALKSAYDQINDMMK